MAGLGSPPSISKLTAHKNFKAFAVPMYFLNKNVVNTGAGKRLTDADGFHGCCIRYRHVNRCSEPSDRFFANPALLKAAGYQLPGVP